MADSSTTPHSAPKPLWRRALVACLTLAVLAVLAAFLLQNRAYIAEHYAPRPGACLAIAALIVVTLVVRSLSHQVLFGPLGIGASSFDWFRLVTVSSFTNYLPLSAGMVAKAFFLKRVHSLPYRTFAVGQVALLVVVVSTNGVVGLATLAVALPGHLGGVVGACFAVMTASGALMLLPMPALAALRRLTGRWLPWDAEAAPALRRGWPAAAAFQVGNVLAMAAAFQIAFAMGSAPVGLAACIVFSAAGMLTRLVAITPGAIGIREFVVGGLAYLTGFDLRDAVIASTALRTVEIAVIFLLGGVFTRRLSDQVISSYTDRDGG
jgi:hypothetical protein